MAFYWGHLHFVEGYICYVKDRIYEIMTLRRLCEFVVLYLPLRFSMDEIYIVGGWIVKFFWSSCSSWQGCRGKRGPAPSSGILTLKFLWLQIQFSPSAAGQREESQWNGWGDVKDKVTVINDHNYLSVLLALGLLSDKSTDNKVLFNVNLTK